MLRTPVCNSFFFAAYEVITLSLELGQDQRLADPQTDALDRVPEAEDSKVPRQCRGSPLLAQDLPRRFFLEQVKHFPAIVREVDVIGSCTRQVSYHRPKTTNSVLIILVF